MNQAIDSNLSTIITSYNTGNDICRAIESVMNQIPVSSECIVVDDGSTDDTRHILDQYFNKYENLHIFYCAHKGVSAARNYGISKAKCKYISFPDSDDMLETNFFQESAPLLHIPVKLNMFSGID